MSRVRAAVLASGGGSNLQALLDHLARLGDRRALDLVLVASDRPGAQALARARGAGIPAAVVRSPRVPEGVELAALLERHDVRLVVLAGYLRLVPADVTRAFEGRMVNVHPGPLPGFGGAGMYGRRVHRAVLAAGVPFTGPSVHLVDEIFDHGAGLAHWPVPVLPADDEHRLAERVLRAEHLLFPRVVQQLASSLRGNGDAPPHAHVLSPFDPELDDATLGQQVDAALAH